MLAAVNLMVSADVQSDENVQKGKREAPMAEPSTEYLPPRLEAPYATYQPIVVGASAQHTSFYQSPTPAPAPAYEYSRYTGVLPLHTVDTNELGNGQYPGPPYGSQHLNGGFGNNNNNNNNIRGGGSSAYGGFIKYGQNAQANYASNYAQSNGFGQSLSVYNANEYDNNAPQLDQYSTIKENSFGNPNSGFDNSFYGNPSFNTENKYPSSAALQSNEPVYAAGIKGLRHYTQSGPVTNLNTQPLKNSRPVALQPAHLARKPPSFLSSEPRNPNFRPSFLLGSSVLSSTPDYNQPFNQPSNQPFNQPSNQPFNQPGNPTTLTSLGTSNQYLPPSPTQSLPEQYSGPQSIGGLPLQNNGIGNLPLQREYLPPFNSASNFANSYQANAEYSQLSQLPITSYGLPETIIYTKSSPYTERYSQAH